MPVVDPASLISAFDVRERGDVAVGTTALSLFGNDPRRVELLVQNIGAIDAFVLDSGAVSTTNGFRLLNGAGNQFYLAFSVSGAAVGRERFVISSCAGTTLYVREIRFRPER